MPIPFRSRRLSDLLADIDFLEIQLQVMQEQGPEHKTANLGQRIAALHRLLDHLERLVRVRAQELGREDPALANPALRRLLRARPDRRKPPREGHEAHVERRKQERRIRRGRLVVDS
jgi:hypothetical protein